MKRILYIIPIVLLVGCNPSCVPYRRAVNEMNTDGWDAVAAQTNKVDNAELSEDIKSDIDVERLALP